MHSVWYMVNRFKVEDPERRLTFLDQNSDTNFVILCSIVGGPSRGGPTGQAGTHQVYARGKKSTAPHGASRGNLTKHGERVSVTTKL